MGSVLTITITDIAKGVKAYNLSYTYTTAGGGDTPSLKESDLALTDAPIALSFDLYNNSDAQVINYTTSSEGAVTIADNAYATFAIDENAKTITVTPVKKTSDEVEITVSQAADETYKAGSATFTVTIDDSTPKTGGWYATSLSDIQAEDVFVIVGNNGSNYALTNDKGTSSAPAAVAVTINGNELESDVEDNMKWNIGGNAEEGYIFYVNGSTESWLYCTNSNNGVRVGNNNSNTFSIDEGYLKHGGTSRYVGVYNSSDWRCYTTNGGNIANQSFAFYVYQNNAAVKKPVITVDETFVGSTTATITCATDGATIYYSFDNENWTEYTAALNITATTTIYAKATKDTDESEVASATTTKVLPTPTVAISGDLTVDLNGETNVSAGTLTAAVTYEQAAVEGAVVAWSSSDEAIATIDANTGAVTLLATGEVTFTATYAGNNDYAEATGTKTITVIDSNVPGASPENPYSVAAAIEATPASGTSDNVYIRGIVSEFYNTSITGDGKNYRYYISDDGTTTDQLLVYRGKGLNDEAFSNDDDLQIGDEVIIYGGLTTYNSAAEVASGNYVYSLSRKEAATITVNGGTEFSINRENNEEELQLTATANSGATVVFTVDTENTTLDAGNYEFEDGLLLVSGNTAGVIVIKANAPAAGNYNAATEVTITVTVIGKKSDATIVVENDNVAYGSTYTIDDSMIEGGAITVTSSNESVATVSGLTITPVAVGTTTVTVSTAETVEYYAGSETFVLTVTAPEGKTTAVAGGFVKVTSTEDITDGQYLIVYEDGGVAFDGSLETLDAVGNTIDVTINESKIDASDATKAAVFTIDAKAGTIQSASGFYIGQTSYANGLATSEEESYAHSFEIDNDGNANISIEVNSNNVSLRYNKASNQTRFRYYKSGQEAIQLYKLNEANLTATLNATTGYATYCSAYPLDFSATKGYSAWQITDIKGTTISFDKVTGSVKGGTGLFLKGTPGATVTLTSVDSENTLDGNLLEGTLAPTYVTEDEYYGLKGDNFVKVNSGIIPAGKAILDADWIETSAGEVKAFTFIFNDVTTGVRTIETVSAEEAAKIFNLGGQRMSNMQRGINIVNGKKVLVK